MTTDALAAAIEQRDFGQIASVIASGLASVAIAGDATGAQISTYLQVGDTRFELTPEVVEELRQALPRPRSNLPEAEPRFKGRDVDEAALIAGLGSEGMSQAITALRGVGGIGKTALAVRVAHKLVLLFPAAQLLIDLRGTRDAPLEPRAVMEQTILRFAPGAKLPDDDDAVEEIYRETLRRHKSLLILDNARDAAQLRPLLPPAPSAAIVTARGGIILPGVAVRRLGSLERDESIALLADLIGPPVVSDHDLDALAAACADHPLALTVAGADLASRREVLTAADHGARILKNRDLLRIEGVEDFDVMASLDLSLQQLTADNPELSQRWRDLAVFPADFDAEAAGAVWDQPEAALDQLLRLHHLGFLEPGTGAGRFRLHDLMRDLARRHQLEDRFTAPARRHAAYLVEVLGRADNLYLAGDPDSLAKGLQLFDGERNNIEAAQAWATGRMEVDADAATLASKLAKVSGHLLALRLPPRELIAVLESALAGARMIGDRDDECSHLGNLGSAYFYLGETRRAIEHYEQSLVIAREIGNRRVAGNALGNLGAAYANLGETRRAIEHHEQSLAIAREIGNRRGEGNALGNLGIVYADLGENDRAIEHHEQALAIAREIGNRSGEGNSLGNLGNAYAEIAQHRRAIEHHEQALVISREIGDRRGEGHDLGNLGVAYANLGETRRAIEHHEQALVISREIGDRRGEGYDLGNLGVAYANLGETRRAIEHYEQALVISVEIGDRRNEGYVLGLLGAAYTDLGETRRARERYEQAIAIFEEIEDPRAAVYRGKLHDGGNNAD